MQKVHSALEQLESLAVLNAMLTERNVTRAAHSLGMSQSALSHALKRLRERLGDPLFVRTREGMAATPLVEQMADPIARALKIVRDEVYERRHFDPATASRTFRVYTGETGSLLLVPRIVEALAQTAPKTRIEMVDIARARLDEALDSGVVELALGYNPSVNANCFQQVLYDSKFTAIVRLDHPGVGTYVDAEQLANMPHITTTSVDSGDTGLGGLHGEGVIPSPVMRLPHITCLPRLVEVTDWIAIIPEELLGLFLKIASVREVRLPTAVRSVAVTQVWHARHNGDPGHQFLRRTIYSLLRAGG